MNEISRRSFLGRSAALSVAGPLLGSRQNVFDLVVQSGDAARRNAWVRVGLLDAPEGAVAAILEKDGRTLTGQISPGGSGATAARELSFVLPELAAGETARFKVTLMRERPAADDAFSWGEDGVLAFGKRPVLRYMNPKLDESTPQERERTYKVFHHVYDPSGERLLTKGAGGSYTHHRGVYYGFNKVTYGAGKTCDVWHCTKDAHQAHEEVLESASGTVFGRHRVRIGWHGVGKDRFAQEDRELTALALPGGTLIRFVSRLTPVVAPLKLDGDPQHAGFHFRADNEVATKTTKETYFVRPDGAGRPGESRNWPGQKDHVNLPWNAMCFVLGGERYSVVYLDSPSNPKEARFSERPYGRFGSYFERTLEAGQDLLVHYGLWIQRGAVRPEEAEALSREFLQPVKGERR